MNPYELAVRYVGLHEKPGAPYNPLIAAMIALARGDRNFTGPLEDETPNCGAFAWWIAKFNLGLEAPADPLRARAWLGVGAPQLLAQHDPGARSGRPAMVGDVVVLSRGPLPQPGPEVERAPGHVGFLAPTLRPGGDWEHVTLVSANVDDAVKISAFPLSRVLGVRRLRPAP